MNRNTFIFLPIFRRIFQETKTLEAHFTPPEICLKIKTRKDKQNMTINEYEDSLNSYKGMNVMR